MNSVYKKQYIPLALKNAVWHKHCKYPAHMEITQCCTCANIVLIPESIRSMNGISNDIKSVFIDAQVKSISGVGEFGHIIAEKNGGSTTEDNLIVQCKNCNTRQGSKNIEPQQMDYDAEMLDGEMINAEYERLSTAENAEMGEMYEACHGVCASGRVCRNKPIINRRFCHIHLTS